MMQAGSVMFCALVRRVGPQTRRFELLTAHVYIGLVRLLVERLSFSIPVFLLLTTDVANDASPGLDWDEEGEGKRGGRW